jgi:hypothetical protein
VAFGLLFQTLLPTLALAAKAQAQSTMALSVICSGHADDQSGDPDGPPPAGNRDLNDCCSVCALLHAAHLAVPPPASPDMLVWPTTTRSIQPAADDRLITAQAPRPYSSRAPPLAS